MTQFLGLVVLVVIIVVVSNALKRMGPRSTGTTDAEKLPYRRKDYLLSKAERVFYEVLRTTVGTDWTIFAKVRLLDLVWLPRGTANVQSHRNKVQSKHVDFVLCNPFSVRPELVIELDDASHNRTRRRERDEFVDAVFRAAGLPLLHIPAKSGYVTADLRRQIDESMRSAPPAPA